MSNKIGVGVIIIVVLALVVALGYIAVRNFGSVPDFFQMPDRSAGYQTQTENKSSSFSPIKVTAPQGGDVLAQGSVYTFRWEGGGSSLTLSLQKSSFLSQKNPEWKIQNIRNTGSYIFYVPKNLSGSYTLLITDGEKKGYSKPFGIEEKISASGWAIYVDSQNLFEMQYPSKINTESVSQKDIYPYKQYSLTVSDFVRAVSLTSADRSKRLPKISILTFSSNGQGLNAWLQSHNDIRHGYASQTRKTYNGKEFYRFSDVKQDVTYRQGVPTYRDRTDVPQEMYLVVSGRYTFAILVDFGSLGKYTIQPEEILRTFKAY